MPNRGKEGPPGRGGPDRLSLSAAYQPEAATDDRESELSEFSPKPLGGLPQRDFDRWPETSGLPPIRGGSGDEEGQRKSFEHFPGKGKRDLLEYFRAVKKRSRNPELLVDEEYLEKRLDEEAAARGKHPLNELIELLFPSQAPEEKED